ncbi:MAG: alcohol dehydrogenase catalytic domain-containing protein [Bacteroidia bacterium]|nr:alcohol dehydrogenase catalytic domain-containing protein [Bacteroidia bacterium]
MFPAKAIIARPDGSFSLEDITVAQPQGDEVVVEMRAAGICHTDYDSLRWGKHVIIGHEGAGVVLETGPLVTSVKPGDPVILNWAVPCGRCFQCQEGNQNICENQSPVVAGNNGFNAGHPPLERTRWNGRPVERSFNLGTLSTVTLVREAAVVKMAMEIPFSSAAIVSCGVMTGYGSVVNAARVKAGSSVVVLGAGGVGLNVIQGARISEAEKIIAIDIHPGKLEMAKTFGATHTLLAEKEDKGLLRAAQTVKTMTGGRGADYCFECTAVPALGAAPLAMVRNAGTAVQVSGIEQEIVFNMELFEWDKIYINPLYGKCRPQIDFPILMNLYKKGDLMLDEMVTQTYTLEQMQQAFEDLIAGKNAKGVVLMGE